MISLTGITAFFIDFDGTLVDTEPFHYKANSFAFEHYGHEIDPDEYYLYWSSLGDGARGEIDRHHLDHIDEYVIRQISREKFEQLIMSEPIPLLKGAERLLTLIPESGFKTVIASNTPEELVRKMMIRSGLPGAKVEIIGGGNDVRGKPFPDIFQKACKSFKLTPDQAVVIEDTYKGMVAAHAGGCRCLLVPSARYPELDYRFAEHIYENLDRLIDDLLL